MKLQKQDKYYALTIPDDSKKNSVLTRSYYLVDVSYSFQAAWPTIRQELVKNKQEGDIVILWGQTYEVVKGDDYYSCLNKTDRYGTEPIGSLDHVLTIMLENPQYKHNIFFMTDGDFNCTPVIKNQLILEQLHANHSSKNNRNYYKAFQHTCNAYNLKLSMFLVGYARDNPRQMQEMCQYLTDYDYKFISKNNQLEEVFTEFQSYKNTETMPELTMNKNQVATLVHDRVIYFKAKSLNDLKLNGDDISCVPQEESIFTNNQTKEIFQVYLDFMEEKDNVTIPPDIQSILFRRGKLKPFEQTLCEKVFDFNTLLLETKALDKMANSDTVLRQKLMTRGKFNKAKTNRYVSRVINRTKEAKKITYNITEKNDIHTVQVFEDGKEIGSYERKDQDLDTCMICGPLEANEFNGYGVLLIDSESEGVVFNPSVASMKIYPNIQISVDGVFSCYEYSDSPIEVVKDYPINFCIPKYTHPLLLKSKFRDFQELCAYRILKNSMAITNKHIFLLAAALHNISTQDLTQKYWVEVLVNLVKVYKVYQSMVKVEFNEEETRITPMERLKHMDDIMKGQTYGSPFEYLLDILASDNMPKEVLDQHLENLFKLVCYKTKSKLYTRNVLDYLSLSETPYAIDNEVSPFYFTEEVSDHIERIAEKLKRNLTKVVNVLKQYNKVQKSTTENGKLTVHFDEPLFEYKETASANFNHLRWFVCSNARAKQLDAIEMYNSDEIFNKILNRKINSINNERMRQLLEEKTEKDTLKHCQDIHPSYPIVITEKMRIDIFYLYGDKNISYDDFKKKFLEIIKFQVYIDKGLGFDSNKVDQNIKNCFDHRSYFLVNETFMASKCAMIDCGKGEFLKTLEHVYNENDADCSKSKRSWIPNFHSVIKTNLSEDHDTFMTNVCDYVKKKHGGILRDIDTRYLEAVYAILSEK